MRREAKLLLEKACDSLVLGIELFNRPYERGRLSGCLILLDHAFEMLLKAAILHRGGSIREKRAKQTIGFDACVRKSLSDGEIKFLREEQALVLQTINGLRDAAQHHLLDVSEGQLYVHIQASTGLAIVQPLPAGTGSKPNCVPRTVVSYSAEPPTPAETSKAYTINQIPPGFLAL
jgi:hypothetical protein